MLADHERELMKKWRVCCGDLEGLANRTSGNLLRAVKFRVMDRVISLAGKSACLSGYDDNLFECCKHLMKYYRAAIEHYEYNKADVNIFSIKKPVLLINEIFNSRLRLFNAHYNDNDENPVAIERIKLLSAGVAYFMFSFNEAEKAYEFARLHSSELAENFTPEFFNSYIELIQNDILDSFVEKNYPAYSKAVQACLQSLNNLNNRKVLAYYYTLFAGESDVLHTVSYQAASVESELTHKPGNLAEIDFARIFLTIVNEAQLFYDSEGRYLIGIIEKLERKTPPEPESMESLRVACGDLLANSRLIANKDYLDTAAKYHANELLVNKCLEENADLFLNQILTRANLIAVKEEFEERIKELALSVKRTAQAIASIFARQVSFYREQEGSLAVLKENSIISGINETLLIKVEVLAENITAFDERYTDISCRLQDKNILINEKEREELLSKLFPLLRAKFFTTEDNDDIIIDAFYNAAAETEQVNAYRRRIADICQKEDERTQKDILRFLKENVLYEISTFEEILQYSVTRLRESDNEYVKDYIDLIDENTYIIETSLKKIGITMIRPKPHDSFNGKEHEILMAEHFEGFSKGEIIKSITSGYKLNNQILVRANIIAAK